LVSASDFAEVCASTDVIQADNRSITMNLLINRLIVALMFSGGLVSGAAAQSLGETYATTQAIFGAAPSKVVADLEGKWLPLSQLAGGIEAAADPGTVSSMMRRFCEKAPLKIEITAPFGDDNYRDN
jgi:hypothetical protein